MESQSTISRFPTSFVRMLKTVLVFLIPAVMVCQSIEVAVVKPSDPDAKGIMNHFASQLFSYTNIPLKIMIGSVYQVRDYQISGAPGWLSFQDRWDIDAKTTAATNMMQKLEALKPVLADRFQLKFHWETRELPIYSLVIAKNGPKLPKFTTEETSSGGIRVGRGEIIGHDAEFARLVDFLGGQLNLPLLNKTGLTGKYDFKLQWTPDENQVAFGDIPAPASTPPPVDLSRPSIFVAVQEQLGLKMEEQKGLICRFWSLTMWKGRRGNSASRSRGPGLWSYAYMTRTLILSSLLFIGLISGAATGFAQTAATPESAASFIGDWTLSVEGTQGPK